MVDLLVSAVSGGGCLEVLGFDVTVFPGDLSTVTGSGLMFVRLLRASEKFILTLGLFLKRIILACWRENPSFDCTAMPIPPFVIFTQGSLYGPLCELQSSEGNS